MKINTELKPTLLHPIHSATEALRWWGSYGIACTRRFEYACFVSLSLLCVARSLRIL